MLLSKAGITFVLRKHEYLQLVLQKRNVQVSIIGAGNGLGSKLALKMKQNTNVLHLKLYDFENDVTKIAKDLDQLPGGPTVSAYSRCELKSAITMCHFIIMVQNSNIMGSKYEIAQSNCSAVNEVCKAISERNPEAILGISTKPINSIIPFASSMLSKYEVYNPFKVFGLANIDVARAKSYAAQALGANPRHITVPVIGGRSDDTVIPLFSKLLPDFYSLDETKAEMLTRLVRNADGSRNRVGVSPTSVALVWSINDCCEKVISAVRGAEVEINCYSANPGFGTRYFGGPVNFGPKGITRTCNNFDMSPFENNLLADSIQHINDDIALGEGLSRNYHKT